MTLTDTAGCQMLRAVLTMFACPGPPPLVYTVALQLGPVRDRTEATAPATRRDTMADPVHIQRNQELDATVAGITDAEGNPTVLDGVPTWETSDSAIVDLRVAEDGLSAIVGSLDVLGGATVTVRADGRHGDEVLELIAVLSVVVAPEDAVVFDLEVGEARDRT